MSEFLLGILVGLFISLLLYAIYNEGVSDGYKQRREDE